MGTREIILQAGLGTIAVALFWTVFHDGVGGILNNYSELDAELSDPKLSEAGRKEITDSYVSKLFAFSTKDLSIARNASDPHMWFTMVLGGYAVGRKII